MLDSYYEPLQNAIVSAKIEGFEVNETVEKDCIRLLTGEVTVEALVSEILNRK